VDQSVTEVKENLKLKNVISPEVICMGRKNFINSILQEVVLAGVLI
jgi:hypothetical protein